ncbi:hypothetical protein UFOVP312_41 [uncultured Caudovirales phage]|uniref:Uncharacterized protein n=1 Tax=uncultured Caudovirales phage TaxID=2100421 RepID=A0A6J5LR27_9CAUD|nr:hypothetical protein UFOVP312_41 [uncultured Caudovirales phage]
MPFQIVNESTLSAIVQNVASMVAFPVPSDPAGDPDPTVQQFVQAANMAGIELLTMYDWQELIKNYQIPIQSDTNNQREKAFPLPVDFFDWIDQTNWNATTQFPSLGPVSPQMWQQLLIRTTLPTLSFYWQVRDNMIYVLAPPNSPQVMNVFYLSQAWVQDQDDPTLYKNRITKNGDKALLDPTLITLYTRVKWLEMKGLDSAAAMRDFQLTFENRRGMEKGAPVLSMARDFRFPYIQPLANTPDTGYGG